MPQHTSNETIEESFSLRGRLIDDSTPVPGLVMVFTQVGAVHVPIPLQRGEVLIGRGDVSGVTIADANVSRQHARVGYDGSRWTVEDLGSRNGTAVDGEELRGRATFTTPRVLRTGKTLLVFSTDLRPFQRTGVDTSGGLVVGPTLRVALDAIGGAARVGDTLHMTGESGSGKELAARVFHEQGPNAPGPFVAVNCATIPEGLAERLLFGARKGAYSGATTDSEGYVQAATGGTLFFDEIAELDLGVQAKMLRVLETHEVLPLGASRAVQVDLRICSATHRDLRAEVAGGRFRDDLYYRIGNPAVRIPPLRERIEEIPWLVVRGLARSGATVAAHASLVEACMLRHWPGNVRELVAEMLTSAQTALAESAELVTAAHLKDTAGQRFRTEPSIAAMVATPTAPAVPIPQAAPERVLTPPPRPPPGRAEIEKVLRETGGRVATTARRLGMHRNQLRRWLARHQVDPRTFGPGDEDSAEVSEVSEGEAGE